MASTKWRDQPASAKQLFWIGKLADEKVTGDLDDVLLDTLADVASEVTITGGQASDLLDILFKAPRKPKPSAGYAPLVSDRAKRKARYDEAKAKYERLEAAREAALAAAGGKAMALGKCVGCGHDDHTDRDECKVGKWVHLGYDSDYYSECSCKEFVAANALHEAARQAGIGIADALHAMNELGREASQFRRGDEVVVARGRKVPKGSKGQILKVSDGAYGMRVFLLLADGSKAWTALTNIDHEEG